MSVITNFFNQITPILEAILLLAVLIGGTIAGISVFKSTKRSGIVKIQNDTIVALQQQIDALKDQSVQQQEKIDQQEEKIDHLEDDMKTMREALEDEGILITIDGKKVTIKNTREPDTTKHIIRKPTRKPTTGVVKKDEA
jgi:uncharacterized coiled-coil protein SlyX